MTVMSPTRDRLADGRRRRRVVLVGDAQQLHDAGDEDREAARDGEQQQGAGAHGRQATGAARRR